MESWRTYNTKYFPPKNFMKDDVTGESLEKHERDEPDKLQKRLQNWEDNTWPVIASFETIPNLVHEIHAGINDPEEVWLEVNRTLAKFFVEEQFQIHTAGHHANLDGMTDKHIHEHGTNLDPDMMAQYKQIFQSFDQDRNGCITQEEMKNAMAGRKSLIQDQAEILSMIQAVDSDGDSFHCSLLWTNGITLGSAFQSTLCRTYPIVSIFQNDLFRWL